MKVIAIDLDGTLLSKKQRIQERDAFWIKEVQGRGHIVAIATGRSHFDALHILESHSLNCPIIASNGAQIYMNDEKVQERFIDQEVVERMVSWLQNKGVYFQLYLADKIVVCNKGIEQIENQLKNVVCETVQFDQESFWESITPQTNQYGLEKVFSIKDIPLKNPVIKIMIVSPDKKILEKVLSQFSEYKECVLSSSGEFNLEIMSAGVDKGVALRLLADRYQVDSSDTVAIGDNLNDLPMFKAAGASILMGNGEKELQTGVTFVTLTNEECGVGYALEFFLPLLEPALSEQKKQLEQTNHL